MNWKALTCPKTRVLVVDDSADLRESLSLFLDSLGYETAQAENGMEALSILRVGEPKSAILVTDFNMPILNGIDLIRSLLRERLPVSGIILMTSESASKQISALQEILAEGSHSVPFAFLEKPFSPDVFSTIVQQICS